MSKLQHTALVLCLALLMPVMAALTPANAQVIKMQPASWQLAGNWANALQYFCDHLMAAAPDQFDCQPSQPGAVCPVNQQAEAVSRGMTNMMAIASGYYSGKVPVGFAWGTPPVVRDVVQLYDLMEFFEDGRAGKVWADALEKAFNVKVIGFQYGPSDSPICSRVNIPSVHDLKGIKIRVGAAHMAATMQHFGASTVFAPSTEIYTMLANNAIDACINNSAYDNFNLSYQEVTKYWTRNPPLMGAHATTLIFNRDAWNKMTPQQQAMIYEAIDASNWRAANEGTINQHSVWVPLQRDFGIIPIDWPAEDQAIWSKAHFDTAYEFSDDPAHREFMDTLKRWAIARGYMQE